MARYLMLAISVNEIGIRNASYRALGSLDRGQRKHMLEWVSARANIAIPVPPWRENRHTGVEEGDPASFAVEPVVAVRR